MINGDSAICYSLPQSRRISELIDERDHFEKQYGLQKKAIQKADALINNYDDLVETHKLDAAYWKKLAKKRNRETAAISSGIGATALGIILYLVLKK